MNNLEIINLIFYKNTNHQQHSIPKPPLSAYLYEVLFFLLNTLKTSESAPNIGIWADPKYDNPDQCVDRNLCNMESGADFECSRSESTESQ